MTNGWKNCEINPEDAAVRASGQPTYEAFASEVDAATKAKTIIDAFAKKQTDGTHLCPCCGGMRVKDRLHTNALSRHADVYVCDSCGMDEAVRDMAGATLPLKDWAIARWQMS